MAGAWRLTKAKHLATAWDGEGARLSGGRWNGVGTAVVYASATLSLALAEVLVHLPGGLLPAYVAVPIEFDEALVADVDPADLPPDWSAHPPPASTQRIGDAWAAAAKAPILKVPSVVVPVEFNYILNPRHPDFRRIHIGAAVPFPFDRRLLRK